MNFTNINDPAGVKALLDQLRSSQAWQDIAKGVPSPEPVPQTTPLPGAVSNSTSSVATLLSQLQSSSIWPPPPPIPSTSHSPIPDHVERSVYPYYDPVIVHPPPTTAPTTPTHHRNQDIKSYTFQQALPYLAQLSEDSNFVASITQLKQAQVDLERKLWEERRAIYKKHEEKVKVARTRANMIGAGLTRHEADMMSDAFKKELRKFDLERVLPAWDGLVVKQQSTLGGLGVPTMCVTDSLADREKQQRVIQVLEGIEGGNAG